MCVGEGGEVYKNIVTIYLADFGIEHYKYAEDYRRLQSVPFELKLNHLGCRLKYFRYHITHFNSSLAGNHAVETALTHTNVYDDT